MKEKDTARKRLRLLLALMALWDLVIGVYAVFGAHHLQQMVQFTPQSEPLFIRGVGVYWLFAAYLQLLGFRDPEKNLVAVQLTIVFRLSAALIDMVEVLFLLDRPFYFFHYMLLFFVVINLIVAYLTARFLRRMKFKWIDVAPQTVSGSVREQDGAQ